ncbi:AAA domain-containing protein [Niabella aurantiaca]|uniref:AAA domain-containing protein n=1 Tax=Niabella aurantiaca TaxID=379900 RepID=UPI00037323E5|nr:AAA domain-containing protein [Niabella aurantiaca]
MSLVGDYNTILHDNIDHNVFEDIFSNKPRNPASPTISNNIKEWHHVIAADPTQNRAVAQSRSGESYVIQGPPGTGKSQTITNLIADLLINDKNILFICEKRAALDVVYHRLNQNKLGELCCYIHDSQGDKKEFYKNLKLVYDDFVNNKLSLSKIEAYRAEVLLKIENHTALLNEFHYQLKSDIEGGVSIRYLIERLLALRQVLLPEVADKSIVPGYGKWKEYGKVILELSKALGSSGADEVLAHHPFANLNNYILRAENPFALFDSIVAHAYESLEIVKALISQYNISASYTDSLEHIKNLIEDAVLLEPIAKSGNLNLTESSGEAAARFEEAWQLYNQLYRKKEDAIKNNSNWLNRFSRQDILQAIPISERYEKAFLGFLNGSWRRLKKRLNQSYDFSSHAVKPSYTDILKQLQDEYSAKEAFANNKEEVEQRYRVEDITQMKKNIDALKNKKGDREVDYLLAHEMPDELVLKLSELNNELQQLELHLKQCLYSVQNKSVAELRNELATIKSNAPVLRQLLPYLREFSELPVEVQNFIRKIPVSPSQAEAIMASCTLDALYKNNQTFATINHALLQRTVSEIETAYKELLIVNGDYIRAKRRAKFLRHYELSNSAAAQLSPDEKRFKKSYAEGRKILEHEMNKTMRYRTIREIASNESGQVLKDVKPVWLMSPLSVSDSLPLDASFFDVVIFDEASQITLEQGIPALFRAPQTIIVGDDKQMPPSNFFNAKAEDPNDLDTFEGEKEDEIISADADSLLVQGARKLNNTMLSWHYRSRHEELISYSNHAFYEGGLLTIPDKKTHYQVQPLLEVKGADDGKMNADLLLKGGISYHYIPGAVYENRGNLSEAKYIAEMLRKLLLDDVKESIGIVAFSQEQQSIIETAIEELAISDRNFESVLDKAFNRNEEGQFIGVFIKNLENVQGDERDIIIMSVCYGFDPNKKMLMNFGPINKKGGEKRLNVIFSRAKKHMAVVSSIRYHNITNDYNPGANYFKRFLHYAELVSTGDLNAAQMILDTLVTNETRTSEGRSNYFLVASQVKRLLEKKGFYVDENVGQSTFKCSLAIKKNKTDGNYTLGILIDDENHYNNDNVVEQYYQKPAILRAFGWHVLNIYAKDWLEDQELVMQRVLKLLNGEELNTPEKPGVKPSHLEKTAPIDENSIFLLAPEQDKFWQLTIQGNTITTKFGKMGTPGLAQVNIFDTAEQAEAMRQEMIKEYKEKGYIEDATSSTSVHS